MRVVRDTPFEVGHVVWSLKPPVVSMTVVVKATFELVADKDAILSSQQEPCTGDMHQDDELDRSVAYETDFAIVKPRGECILIGACNPPAAAARVTASFAIGPIKKALSITGDRYWIPSAFGHIATEPLPFASMPLRWERSFGGPGNQSNPFGAGIAEVETENGRLLPLPNIEDPAAPPITSPRDRPPPWGACPVARASASRQKRLGTFDARWKKTRWPWFPEDFDPHYYQGAPLDQQIEGYFRGDERIVLANLVPGKARLASRLPGIRARCFCVRRDRFDEVRLVLDTIVVDTDSCAAIALFRGRIDVADEKCSDVVHLFAMHELLTEASSDEACRARYDAILAARKAEDAPPVEAEEAAKDEVPLPPVAPAEAPELDALRKQLADMGIDLDAELAKNEAASAGSADPAALRQELKAAYANAGLEPDPELEKLGVPEPPPPPAPPASAPRDQVTARLAKGESLAGIDLSGVDLSGLAAERADFAGASFAKANLRGAKLDGAKLVGASLAGADVEGASFKGADLGRADATGVHGEGVVLHGAKLDGATFDGAKLPGADLGEASLVQATFEDADLTKANFEGARLDRADLSRAALGACVFTRASLVDTRLTGAHAEGARFDGADLTKLRAANGTRLARASMREAIANGARFAESDLSGVDLFRARLERADFDGAKLPAAKLDATVLKQARLRGADLGAATLKRADAFGADFEGADLRKADLRGANLFSANLFRANTDGALLEGADVARTVID